MEYQLLTILAFLTFNSSAQEPNPDLFQTWYLTDMYIQFGPPFDVMEPPVLATLTISDILDFSGQGSCNTVTGSYTYDLVTDSFF
jgi:heat shock protein HslJ